MNEILLYEIYRQVLAANSLFQGRFVVAKNWGVSLNADNFEAEVTDALGGLVSAQKYPCVILFPPTETMPDKMGYATMALTFLFLEQPPNERVNPNAFDPFIGAGVTPLPANRFFTPMTLTWNRMAAEARAFAAMLGNTIKAGNLLSVLHPLADGRLERISSTGNDAAAGVMLTATQKVYFGIPACIDTSSYATGIPSLNLPVFV